MKTLLLWALLLPFLLIGCTEELGQNGDLPDDIICEVSDFDPGKPAIFGEKLNIPYTIGNMRAAFNDLSPATRGGLSADDVIINTHNYIKFIFQTDEQFDYVRNAGIEMYFIPMNIDVTQGGYYADEGNPDGTRIRYCVVTAEQMNIVKESQAEFEILEELFMPDEEEYTTATRSGISLPPTFIDELVRKSYILTGNEGWLPDGEVSMATRGSRPQGRIQYCDKASSISYRYIGMSGLKVKAIRLLKTATGICDANGYYSCDKTFDNKWRYETTFERNDFDINRGRNGSFAYVSDKTTGSWSFSIWDENSEGYFMSTIFRAAYHYYYEDISGLRRPPQNSFWKTQMKLAAMFEDSSDNGNISLPRRFLGMGNAIHIFNPKRYGYEIYSTVIHELAHASHWNIAQSDYNQENEEMYRIRNTWARGVQYSLVRMKYPTYPGAATMRPRYTQLVVDLMDSESDDENNFGLNIEGKDNVHGYTIRQIEDCLQGTRTWSQWRTKIYNMYPSNTTRGNLKALFDSWE